jgi:hypothetical protein
MPDEKPVYRPLPVYSDTEEVERTLRSGRWEDLMVLPLALGNSWHDWKYAQSICLRLVDHADAAIRANACLGLAYVARTQGRLEKHLVKPVLLRELRSNLEFRGRVQDAVDDINSFLRWRLGKASDTM